MRKSIFIVSLALLTLAGCGHKDNQSSSQPQEDPQAKKLLQGIWLNDDDESVAFMAKGDSIFYPDTTSQPVRFKIVHDSLFLEGAQTVKYQIIKQAAHLFEFKNQNGDVVKLTRSTDKEDAYVFLGHRPVALNQNRLIKRDSVVAYGKDKYHCYVQVNPTTYKVIKAVYNDEGVEVENVYYDNIIHLSIFKGGTQIFSHDLRKNDFKGKVPDDYLPNAILSDLTFTRADAEGVHHSASICIPDSPSSYLVDVCVSYDGKLTMKVNE